MADNNINGEVDVAEANDSSSDLLGSIYTMMHESIKDVASSTLLKSNKLEKRKQEVSKKDRYDAEEEKYSNCYYRDDMKPDRSKTDYYCKICQAHMNSEDIWEAHISGKRHLKNIQKHPSEMPSKVRSIKIIAKAKLLKAIKEVDEPVVGLEFMTELQRYDRSLKPSYTCHLCQANCTSLVVIDHILTTKHRLAYMKAVDPKRFEALQSMELNRTCLDQLVENEARKYEERRGCGKIEVKLEKPKMAPPPPRRDAVVEEVPRVKSRSSSATSFKSSSHHHSRSRNSTRSKPYRSSSHRRSRASSEEKSRHASALQVDTSKLSTSQKIELMKVLLDDICPIPRRSLEDLPSIITDLSASILQYKISQLPQSVQNKVARHIARNEISKYWNHIVPHVENIFDGIHNINLKDYFH